MHAIHAKARTTPAVRAEIARSREPTGVRAQRYSVSTETIRTQARPGRLSGPLQPPAQAALESHGRRAGHRLCAASRDRLSLG